MEDIADAVASEAAQLATERAARLVHQASTLPPPPSDDTSGEVPLGTTVVGTSDAPSHAVEPPERNAAADVARTAPTPRFAAVHVAPWTLFERALAMALAAAILALIVLALTR